jgi:hypothetical protein
VLSGSDASDDGDGDWAASSDEGSDEDNLVKVC